MTSAVGGEWLFTRYAVPIEQINHPKPLVAIIKPHLRLEGLLAHLLRVALPMLEAQDFACI